MKISNLVGCTGSVLLLLLITLRVPLVGLFFSLFIPLPFLYYASKLGLYQGLITGAVTVFIVGVISRFLGNSQIVILCLEFGVIGMIISEIFRRQFTFGFTIFWGTAIMLLVGALVLLFIGLSRGMGPIEVILGYFQGNINNTIGLYQNMGLDQEKVLQLKQLGTVLNDLIARIYPSLFIVGTGVIVWINVVASKPLFRLGGLQYPDLGKSDRWQVPEYLIWGLIASGFSLFFPITGIKFIALNTLIILSVVYVFQGLSIVLFFFKKYNVPAWARIGVYTLLIVQQVFLIILAFAGVFDQWIDFRKINKKEA